MDLKQNTLEMTLITKKQYGYQGRKKYTWYLKKKYNRVIVKDYYYCKPYNFIVKHEDEARRLYNAQPCMETDQRYTDYSDLSWPTHIFWTRFKDQPLKKLIRIAKSVRNAEGVTFTIDSSYNIGVRTDYHIKGSNLKFDPEYRIDVPEYSGNFINGGWAQELTDRLRQEGFLVRVNQNYNRLDQLLDTALEYTGQPPVEREPEKFQVAVAHGFGKRIGFSEGTNDFCGYYLGKDNVLFDNLGYFDKWSRCETISKDTPLDEIVKQLKTPYVYEN